MVVKIKPSADLKNNIRSADLPAVFCVCVANVEKSNFLGRKSSIYVKNKILRLKLNL